MSEVRDSVGAVLLVPNGAQHDDARGMQSACGTAWRSWDAIVWE